MTSVVLDASALLAYLQSEPGADVVAAALDERATMSTLNWSEVAGKLRQGGLSVREVQEILLALGDVELVPFTQAQAEAAAWLSAATRPLGLSLGDRACLVLAELLQDTALTADRAWGALGPKYRVRLIR